jgi:hypothetical protein
MSSAATSNDGEIGTVVPHKEQKNQISELKKFLIWLAVCHSPFPPTTIEDDEYRDELLHGLIRRWD